MNARRFAAAIDDDGMFGFDDVPPGKYELEIRLDDSKAEFLGQRMGSYKSFVEIELADKAAETQQLGDLQLAPEQLRGLVP